MCSRYIDIKAFIFLDGASTGFYEYFVLFVTFIASTLSISKRETFTLKTCATYPFVKNKKIVFQVTIHIPAFVQLNM